MNHKIKVSVVVPVYNVEKTLDKCLESLMRQTYMPYEIILIDDGSKDNSGEICDRWANKHDIIRAIHKSNAGLGYARNTGIENATGDSILFLDSDDYFGDKLIEHLVFSMIDSKDTIISGYIRVKENGEKEYDYKYDKTIYEGSKVKKVFLSRMMGSLPDQKDAIDMGATHVLYSLTIIRDNKIRFPSERELISEDIIFNIHYYQYVNRVVLTDFADYYYVVFDNSLTHKYRKDRFEKCLVLYREEERLLKSYQLYDQASLRLKKTFFNSIRMCLAQEKRQVSNKGFWQRKKAVAEICDNELVRQIIKEYPIRKLGLSQRSFVYILKYRMSLVMTVLIDMNFIS